MHIHGAHKFDFDSNEAKVGKKRNIYTPRPFENESRKIDVI